MSDARRRSLTSIVTIVLLLAAWEIVARTLLAHANLLPGPLEIVAGIVRDWRLYPRNIAATLSVAARA